MTQAAILARLRDMACVTIMLITPTTVGAVRGRSAKMPMSDGQGHWQGRIPMRLNTIELGMDIVFHMPAITVFIRCIADIWMIQI